MKTIDCPSPNYDSRNGIGVDMLVLHYTGMKTADEAKARLCDPASKVSAHYIVYEDGTIIRMVPEGARAWHAGISSWRGNTNINQRSIGVEIANPGHEFGYRPFPIVQMKVVATLCRDILSRHMIPSRNIVGHSDIAPTRKEDPGELFDWTTMAKLSIGLWPKMENPLPPAPAEKLAEYGYETADMPKAITAFQRHFRATSLTGAWDDDCGSRLAGLLTLIQTPSRS